MVHSEIKERRTLHAGWCSTDSFVVDFDWPLTFHDFSGQTEWTEWLTDRRHHLQLEHWRRCEPAYDEAFQRHAKASRIRLYQFLARQRFIVHVTWKSVVFAEAKLSDISYATIAPFFDRYNGGIELTRLEWLGTIHYLAHGDSRAQETGLIICSS